MMALLPLIVLAGLVLLAHRKSGDWLQALAAGVVAWGCLLVFITEGLSFVQVLTAPWLVASWAICGVLVGLTYRMSAPTAKQQSVFFPVDRDLADWLALGLIVASVLITFIIGLFAVPSLWDALSYHVPRIMHWAQNQSVAYYQTHNQRQLWSAPGAEFITLHFYVLGRTDRVMALVPWGAFVVSIAVSSLIARELGATPRGQLIASMFAASLPAAIAQSTGGQVEIITGMWICCFVWLGLRLLKHDDLSWPLVILAGGSLGLALLTKPIAYLFTVPFLVWFGAASFFKSWKRAIVICLSVAVIALSLNVFQYRRNIPVYDRPVAGPGSAGTQNKSHSFGSTTSSFVRNSVLHFGTRSPRLNLALFNTVAAFHRTLGIPLNDPRTTLPHGDFGPIVMNLSEATIGSPLHVVLFTIASGFLLLWGHRRSRTKVIWYVTAIGAGYLLFCTVLKWGPWNARLQLPLLLLASAAVGWWIGSWRGPASRTVLAGFLSLSAMPALFLNPDRPLLRHRPVYAIPRDERYFVEVRGKFLPYRNAADYIATTGCRRIGLWMGWNDWEYPLWAFLRERSLDRVEIRHIQVTNKSARVTQPERSAFSPCMFVSVNNWGEQWSFSIPAGFDRAWQQDSIVIFRPITELSSQVPSALR